MAKDDETNKKIIALTEHQEQLYERTVEKLKKENVRMTAQRSAILRYLIQTDTHPTAEQIYAVLGGEFRSMSLATVYNNVNMLVQYHLVKPLKSKDDAVHFDFNGEKHYHVICTRCGRIVDLFYPILYEVEDFAQKETQFMVTGHHLEIYGICPQCQRELSQEESKN
ncbi:MAG: Fur family transcriptional regulator [Aerococcus sp.]|nr:Fur family transcriptional regulator [Aerococcus sp.]